MFTEWVLAPLDCEEEEEGGVIRTVPDPPEL